MAQSAIRSSHDDLRLLVQEDEQLPPSYITICDTAPEWPQRDNQPPGVAPADDNSRRQYDSPPPGVAPADVNPRQQYDSPPPAYHSANIEPATLHLQYIAIPYRIPARAPQRPGAAVAGARANQNRGRLARPNFDSESNRDLLARKVYANVTCQLLITAGFVAVFIYNPFIKSWVQKTAVNHSFLWITAVVSVILCGVPIVFEDSVKSKCPANFIWLVIFTLAKSLLLGVISCAYNTQWIFIAVSLTMVACVIMTAFGSRIDRSVCACIIVMPLMSYGVFFLTLLQQQLAQLPPLAWGFAAPFVVLLFLSYIMKQTTNNNNVFLKTDDFMYTVLNVYWNLAGFLAITFFVTFHAIFIA